MKIRIYYSVAIFIIVSSFILYLKKDNTNFEQRAENSQLKIYLNTEFSTYIYGQSIWVKVILINRSASSFFLKEDFDFIGINFEILNPNNTKVSNSMKYHVLHTDSIKINPNDSIEVVFPIDSYINSKNNIEGMYQVRAIFQNIPSNIVNFKMIPPVGDCEAQYILFNKLTSTQFNISMSQDEVLRNYSNYLISYPTGPFSPDFFDFSLIGHIRYGEKNKIEGIVSDFFDYNYNSYTTKFIVENYYNFLIKYEGYSNSDALEKIKKLSINNAGSESAKIINNFVKNTSLSKE